MQKTWVQSLGQEDLLKKEMATPSLQYSCLGNLMDRGARQATIQSMGLQRVGHDLVTKEQKQGKWCMASACILTGTSSSANPTVAYGFLSVKTYKWPGKFSLF